MKDKSFLIELISSYGSNMTPISFSCCLNNLAYAYVHVRMRSFAYGLCILYLSFFLLLLRMLKTFNDQKKNENQKENFFGLDFLCLAVICSYSWKDVLMSFRLVSHFCSYMLYSYFKLFWIL